MGGGTAECGDCHAPQYGKHHNHDGGCAERQNDLHVGSLTHKLPAPDHEIT
jgi:hypothetical protein